jgi:hypothetical protein
MAVCDRSLFLWVWLMMTLFLLQDHSEALNALEINVLSEMISTWESQLATFAPAWTMADISSACGWPGLNCDDNTNIASMYVFYGLIVISMLYLGCGVTFFYIPCHTL